MHDVVVVQEGHTLQQHNHVAFDLSWGQGAVSVPYHLREVRHHEVKHQHKAGTVREDAFELHHLQHKRRPVPMSAFWHQPCPALTHLHAHCPRSPAGPWSPSKPGSGFRPRAFSETLSSAPQSLLSDTKQLQCKWALSNLFSFYDTYIPSSILQT